jgi:hypothetical protein
MTSRRRVVVAAAVATAISGASFAQDVRWEPELRFPGTFFPAFAMATAGLDNKGPVDNAQAAGYTASASFMVRLSSAPAGARVKVRVEIPEIGVTGEIETTAPGTGQVKYIAPRLSWSQARLASIDQPISTEVIFTVAVDGSQTTEQRRPLRVRAANDSPLLVCSAPGRCRDYFHVMAAFVNEDHPIIDRVLRSTLEIPALPVKQWIGTQGSEQQVLQQVWAIWYWFQRNRVTYSSITTVSDVRADLTSQTVRPISQALATRQANCIDGSALFASILRKIGIEPILVFVPGHAFLGFYLDAQQTKPMFLETTMLNTPANPFYQAGPTKAGTDLARMTGSDIHANQSWRTFTDAIAEGNRRYTQAEPYFGKQAGYMAVPIKKARSVGVLPVPL